MREIISVIIIGFAVGFCATFAAIGLDAWIRRAHRVRCQYCHHRYRPDESLACVPEAYCSESCEVAELEKMITAIRR
jgi:hypothetical protein